MNRKWWVCRDNLWKKQPHWSCLDWINTNPSSTTISEWSWSVGKWTHVSPEAPPPSSCHHLDLNPQAPQASAKIHHSSTAQSLAPELCVRPCRNAHYHGQKHICLIEQCTLWPWWIAKIRLHSTKALQFQSLDHNLTWLSWSAQFVQMI